MHRLLNPLGLVAFKMGRLRGGPSRTGVRGAYLDRYVTDPATAGQSPRDLGDGALRGLNGKTLFVKKIIEILRD